jgi:hypothetical protein
MYIKILNSIGKIHKDDIYTCLELMENGIAIIQDDKNRKHYIPKGNYELIFD